MHFHSAKEFFQCLGAGALGVAGVGVAVAVIAWLGTRLEKFAQDHKRLDKFGRGLTLALLVLAAVLCIAGFGCQILGKQ